MESCTFSYVVYVSITKGMLSTSSLLNPMALYNV